MIAGCEREAACRSSRPETAAAARDLGERYSLGDLVLDLRHGQPYLPDPAHPDRFYTPPLEAACRYLGVLCPLVLYAGNHLNPLIRVLIAATGGQAALHWWDSAPPGALVGRSRRGSLRHQEAR